MCVFKRKLGQNPTYPGPLRGGRVCVAFGALLQSALVTPHGAVCRKSSRAKREILSSTIAKIKINCEGFIEEEMLLLVCVSCHWVPSLILIHMNTPDISLLVRVSRICCRKHKHGHKCNKHGHKNSTFFF